MAHSSDVTAMQLRNVSCLIMADTISELYQQREGRPCGREKARKSEQTWERKRASRKGYKKR